MKTYALSSSENIKQASIGNFQEPSFIILSVCLLVMLILIIVLSAFVCKLRRRPRIKKRIIVNKNVTPLTYTPTPNSQQCEITIENCCNMNVCETVSVKFLKPLPSIILIFILALFWTTTTERFPSIKERWEENFVIKYGKRRRNILMNFIIVGRLWLISITIIVEFLII